jgi:UrcA family protein
MSVKNFAGSRAVRPLTATLLLSACVASALAANFASAADATSTASVVVRYSDLNAATPSGAAKLYRRISSAAHKVCPDAKTPSLADKMATWSCRREAVNRAVEAVNSPEVASVSKHPQLASAH